MGVTVGAGPTEMAFSSAFEAVGFVERATNLRATAAGKGNPFSSGNAGTWAIVTPTAQGAHMTFGLVLPNNGGMYAWDPLIGGSTRSVAPATFSFEPGTKLFKFE